MQVKPPAITVRYWIGEIELGAVDEFRMELAENYAVSLVRSRPGGLGGGLYQLLVEFVSHLTLADAVKILLEGAAYDLVKSGTDAFFIRPFVNAYKRFRDRNKDRRLGIDRVRFIFQDISICIEALPNTDVLEQLDCILLEVGHNLETLIKNSKEQIFELYIPVFEDSKIAFSCKFRTLLSEDETIDIKTISKMDYLKYWGLEYDYSQSEVYDVGRRLIIREHFCTERQYWAEWELTRKRKSGSKP